MKIWVFKISDKNFTAIHAHKQLQMITMSITAIKHFYIVFPVIGYTPSYTTTNKTLFH